MTLALLAAEVVRLTTQTGISRATIGRRLAENALKPWQQKMWCVPQIDADVRRAHGGPARLYTTPQEVGPQLHFASYRGMKLALASRARSSSRGPNHSFASYALCARHRNSRFSRFVAPPSA